MKLLKTWGMLAVTVVSLATPAAFAAEALKVVVPTAPGGGTDGYFRVLTKEAEPFLQEPIIVVNVPGAGGTIGVAQVVRATPDGQTVAAVWLGPVTVSPHTVRRVRATWASRESDGWQQVKMSRNRSSGSSVTGNCNCMSLSR